MRRRPFLATLGAAVVAPLALAADRVRVVGLLTAGSGSKYLAAAMAPHGWIEGRNVRYEVRRVAPEEGDLDPPAQELVRAGAEVLVGMGAPIVLALSRASRTLPIVCGGISDPVEAGLARSIREPGGNVTGLSFGLPEAAMLQLGTLKVLVPGLKRVVFVDAQGTFTRPAPAHEAALRSFGFEGEVASVKSLKDIERALASLRSVADAAWVAVPPKGVPAKDIAAAAIRRRIATHAMGSADVKEGMLLAYWIVHANPLERIAGVLDQVLRGAAPARIPFQLPDKTSLAINRATAKTLGLRVGEDLLVRATEVYGSG